MINLLPIDSKKKLTREYVFRVATAALVVASVVMVIGYVLLIPSYVLTASKENLVEQEREALHAGDEFTAFDELRDTVSQVNQRLDVMVERPPFLVSEAVLLNLLLDKTSEVTFTNISYTRRGQGDRAETIDLRGTAVSRSALVEFIQVLEDDPAFEVASAPVSNYVAAADLSFLLQVAIVVPEKEHEESN